MKSRRKEGKEREKKREKKKWAYLLLYRAETSFLWLQLYNDHAYNSKGMEYMNFTLSLDLFGFASLVVKNKLYVL